MDYNVYLVNADGSGSLIGTFPDLVSAQGLANTQSSGTTCRIELGDAAQSTIIEFIVVP